MATEDLALPILHPLSLDVDDVVPPEQVEHPMDDEELELCFESDLVLDCVARSHCRADHDVAQQDLAGRVERLLRRWAADVRVRHPTRDRSLVVDRKAQHVGRALLAEELLVERGDGGLIDEEQGHLCGVRDPLIAQRARRQRHETRQIDLEVLLLVGPQDVRCHRGPVGAQHGRKRRRCRPRSCAAPRRAW